MRSKMGAFLLAAVLALGGQGCGAMPRRSGAEAKAVRAVLSERSTRSVLPRGRPALERVGYNYTGFSGMEHSPTFMALVVGALVVGAPFCVLAAVTGGLDSPFVYGAVICGMAVATPIFLLEMPIRAATHD